MYAYIYDVFLSDKRYEKELIKIENSLTDLDLRGTTIRLSLLNSIGHTIQDLLSRGVKTLVTVGGDQLFSRLADYADDLQDVTLGIIPLGPHQEIAQLFGIPNGEKACDVLGARLIRPVQLGRINSGYFIHSVTIDDPRVKVACDDSFAACATTEKSVTSIHNLLYRNGESASAKNHLSVMIRPSAEKRFLKKGSPITPTIIQTKQVQILEPHNVRILVDGQKVMKTPAKLKVARRKIQVIMGKNRKI